MSAVLGIDIGTSYFSGAVWWRNNYYFIENDESVQRIPSFVTYRSQTQQTVGEPAKQCTEELHKRFYNIKMMLGRKCSDPTFRRIQKDIAYVIDCDDDDKPVLKVALPDKTLTLRPEDVQSALIRYLKRSAEERSGQSVDKAVVTVPAYFDDDQRQATIDACTKAGIRVLQLINEPTAAVFGIFFNRSKVLEPDSNVIVFDMGFFSTKVTMLTIEAGVIFKTRKIFEFIGVGGNHFDYRIAVYIIKYIRCRYNAEFSPPMNKLAYIRNIAEKGRISLSSLNVIMMEIEDDDRRYEVVLTRETFEKMCSDIFREFLKCFDEVYKTTRRLNFQTDKVVVMGGAFKIPMMRNTIYQFLGNEFIVEAIDEVVAFGAAIRGGMLIGQLPGQLHDLMPVDVLPNSLGVSTGDEDMVFVVKKGVKLPCTRDVLLTLEYNDVIKVMEGEGLTSLENRCLGSMFVTSVKPTEPKKVKVSFEVTVYCIVNVILHISNTCEILHLKVYANEPDVPLNELPVQNTESPRVESPRVES